MPLAILTKSSAALGRALLGASRDLAPIITVITLFQVLVLHQPFPELLSILAGLGLVIVGLALFVVGLDIGLFPLGETLAEEFARKGSLFWLLLFAFALGAGTTVAEPALIAVTREGAKAAAEAGLIQNISAFRLCIQQIGPLSKKFLTSNSDAGMKATQRGSSLSEVLC